MDENYLITINGIQRVSGNYDKVSLVAPCSYKFSNLEKKLEFYEYDSDVPEKKTLSNIIVDENNTIVFTKDGEIKSQLILQKGKRHMCYYATQFGDLNIGTYTNKLSVSLDESGGEIYSDYIIDINSSVTSYNTIHVVVKKIGGDHV